MNMESFAKTLIIVDHDVANWMLIQIGSILETDDSNVSIIVGLKFGMRKKREGIESGIIYFKSMR
jgi:hypothetical protein